MSAAASVVIRKTPAELFALWRDLTLVAHVLTHVDAVERVDERRWRWRLAPAGAAIACIEVSETLENERIAWHSAPDSPLEASGALDLTPTNGATRLALSVAYRARNSAGAHALRQALGDEPGRQVARDLERLRDQLERGQRPGKDVVEEASEESFPASDAPS